MRLPRGMSLNKAILIAAVSIGTTSALALLYLLSFNSNSNSSESKQSLSIMAAGDSIGYNVQSKDLSDLQNLINGTDIFIFNLEGSLRDSNDAPRCKGFWEVQSVLTSDTTFVRHMKLAPLTIANMANNHILDCGSEGIERTKRILDEQNILHLGAGRNLEEACKPLFVNVKGYRLVFVSYDFVLTDRLSASPSRAGAATLDACDHDYRKMRTEGTDLVIASVHYGYWSANVTQGQVELVKRLFDSGVDVVIGHSPHIPQAIMVKDGKLAFFSLGNFVFRPDYEMPPLAYTTIVPRINVYKDKIEITIYPARIDRLGVPHLVNDEQIISRIAKASREFNTTLRIYDNLGHASILRNIP